MSAPQRIVCLTEETTETLYLLGEDGASTDGLDAVAAIVRTWVEGSGQVYRG